MKLAASILTSVLLLLQSFSGCNRMQDETSSTATALAVPHVQLDAEAGQQFVYVEAGAEWTLTLDFGSASPWASLSRMSGTGSASGIVLMWEANVSDAARSFTMTLTCRKDVVSSTLSQVGKDEKIVTPSSFKSDVLGAWMELPGTGVKGMFYISHSMTLGGRSFRNWSFCLDPEAKIATWVAYPLNKSLVGSGSRTDEWALDPKVPEEYQPVLYKGFSSGYQRGHQIPSADRLSYSANRTTFYFTNMTPQRGELNEKAWAGLESLVRDWSYSLDTLYVVTGADIRNSSEVAYDNVGKEIPVPVGYYKALLGYAKGQNKYYGIAFYFEHKSYTNSVSAILKESVSIDALEKKMDMDFFVNLPAAIGKSQADAVEAAVDKWWSEHI